MRASITERYKHATVYGEMSQIVFAALYEEINYCRVYTRRCSCSNDKYITERYKRAAAYGKMCSVRPSLKLLRGT